MPSSTPESERLAVLEHRADRLDESFGRIENYLRELTALSSEMVKLQTMRVADIQRIERLEAQVDKVDSLRAEQHVQTEEWAKSSTGIAAVNASWVDYFKLLLVGGTGAAIGAWLTALFASG